MRAGFISRRFFLLLLIVVFLYLSLYTWNLRYGYLDRLSEITGMEIAGWLLKPGNWVADEVSQRWHRYVHLMGVEQENEELRAAVGRMALDMASLREDSARVQRLEHYLDFKPPEQWMRQGARIIAHRLGPTGTLETFLVDKGGDDGIHEDSPVITPEGVVGRVMRASPSTSTVLLLNDPNSHIPVLGRDSRTTGIIVGQGPGQPLVVNYVPLNAPMSVGEILVSSGLARVFPKGVPVARVVMVERSDISLFKTVLAEPLIDVRNLEQVLVLTRQDIPDLGGDQDEEPSTPQAVNATKPQPASPATPVKPQAAKPQPVQAQKPQAQPARTSAPAVQTPVAQVQSTPRGTASQAPVRPAQTQNVAQSSKPQPQKEQGEAQAAKPQGQQSQVVRVPVVQDRTPQAQSRTSVQTPSVSPVTPNTAATGQATAAAPSLTTSRTEVRDRVPPQPQAAAQPATPGAKPQVSTVPDAPQIPVAPSPAAQPAPAKSATPAVRPDVAPDSQAQRQTKSPAGGSAQPAWPPVLQSPVPAQEQASPSKPSPSAVSTSGGGESVTQTPAQRPAKTIPAPQPQTSEQSPTLPATQAETAE